MLVKIASFPQVGVKIKTIWNHHPVLALWTLGPPRVLATCPSPTCQTTQLQSCREERWACPICFHCSTAATTDDNRWWSFFSGSSSWKQVLPKKTCMCLTVPLATKWCFGTNYVFFLGGGGKVEVQSWGRSNPCTTWDEQQKSLGENLVNSQSVKAHKV